MAFSVTTRTADGVAGLDPTLIVLADDRGNLAEVWPALGFNCVRWSCLHQGRRLELLYSDPALFQGARPTRSGIPVLFPFPNRIRDGVFSWDGREYRLPPNDPAQKNAIHGFACRSPWRVVDQGADDNSAFVTGVFRCSADAPESRPLWPADHEISLTVRLGNGTLRLEAEVFNPDVVPLPFGLGYHPYFRLPFLGTGSAEDCLVEVPAAKVWPLDGNLPAGEPTPIDAARNLDRPRPVGELKLDDVLTGLPARAPRMDGLIERGAIHVEASAAGPGATMRLFCDPAFREMVVFTPPHRQAFCIEPYTCPTDAANLGGDVGWKVLPPGGRMRFDVELWV